MTDWWNFVQGGSRSAIGSDQESTGILIFCWYSATRWEVAEGSQFGAGPLSEDVAFVIK